MQAEQTGAAAASPPPSATSNLAGFLGDQQWQLARHLPQQHSPTGRNNEGDQSEPRRMSISIPTESLELHGAAQEHEEDISQRWVSERNAQ